MEDATWVCANINHPQLMGWLIHRSNMTNMTEFVGTSLGVLSHFQMSNPGQPWMDGEKYFQLPSCL